MTKSFFLVHLIDKSKYYGINALYNIPHDLFIKGRSCHKSDIIYIQKIEPEPVDQLQGGFGTNTHSLWLGVGIIPKDTFEENVELYKNLCGWIMDFLYLSRFLVNLNLKARVMFHVENYSEENKDSKLSFQRIIDINCVSGSRFQVRYNQYDLVLPLLTKLLQYSPTDKLRAIMYNHATSQTGNSGVINYFFSFATFEGIINNWADANGYSQLWGTAVATQNEQVRIHGDLRTHFAQFISNHDYDDEKLSQLISFKDSTFPLDRKIFRSLKQRFMSYYNLRLTADLRENEDVLALLNQFRRIYLRRNEIGHSIETYLGSPGLIEDVNVLMSTNKIIMDFELNQFLNGEIDWKFENRINNLRDNMEQMTQTTVLDKFSYNVTVQNPNNIHLKDRFGTRNIEEVKFQSEMINDAEEDSKLIFFQDLKLILPQDFSRRMESATKSGIVNAYADPYWWISATQDTSHYIIKTFPPTRISYTFERDVRKVTCEISLENILSVVKLDFIDIPDDLDVFACERQIN